VRQHSESPPGGHRWASQRNIDVNSTTPILARKQLERANTGFNGYSTQELMERLSGYRQDRLDTSESPDLADSTRENTLRLLELWMAPIVRELKRRHDQLQRHRNDPHAGTWPQPRQYEKTVHLARELKQAIPLSVYIHYVFPAVELRKHGTYWQGHCPYPGHEDKSPSFTVYQERFFECYGCGETGDIFTLVSLVDGLERFDDAVKSLALWAGKAAQL
jgi:hypothetical protein